mmetsp:Transcript_38119/g.57455  ORF Transcript_38119/g.57455 Transcript_38119/m.57455 type:complete len:91 (+) Transcript_38119:137-409(+)
MSSWQDGRQSATTMPGRLKAVRGQRGTDVYWMGINMRGRAVQGSTARPRVFHSKEANSPDISDLQGTPPAIFATKASNDRGSKKAGRRPQ